MFELNEFVSMMSAPGFEILPMNLTNHLRLRDHQHVGGVLEVNRMRLERLAAIGFLGRLIPMHHRPHRAIEDQDAVFEKIGKKITWIRSH